MTGAARALPVPDARDDGRVHLAVVHAAVRGRARIRIDGLHRNHALAAALQASLSTRPGIRQVSTNPLTGNLLVLFDRGRDLDDVLAEVRLHAAAAMAAACSASATAHPPTADEGDSLSLLDPIIGMVRAAADEVARFLSLGFPSGDAAGAGKVPPPAAGALQPDRPWHALDIAEVEAFWGSSRVAGLSSALAAERLRLFGRHTVPEASPPSWAQILLRQFVSLPVVLLFGASAVAIFTGGLVEALVILGEIAADAVIGAITEHQAELTLATLTRLGQPTALVIRDAVIQEIPGEDVVAGDLVVLARGSYVPADARLVDLTHLTVDESVLTGESMPAAKVTGTLPAGPLPLGERVNMVYRRTVVTGGSGLAIVVATGLFTVIGRFRLLIESSERPETPLQQDLAHLGSQLALGATIVCIVAFGTGLLRRLPFLQMLQAAVALAVAAIPEGLPTVATTTLAFGIRDLRRHNVLVRRLAAVEALGAMQVLCLDKTGTITMNRMVATEILAGSRRYRLAFPNVYLNGRATRPLAHADLIHLLETASLCNEADIVVDTNGAPPVLRGDADGNRHRAGRARRRHRRDRAAAAAPGPIDGVPVGDPQLHAHHARGSRRPGRRHQGQPGRGGAALHAPATRQPGRAADRRRACRGRRREPAHGGARVACARHRPGRRPGRPDDGGMVLWLGLIGITDPPRAGVKDLVAALRRAGIRTVMITGDQSATALAIARELDLAAGSPLVLIDSTRLETLDPELLRGLVQRVHVVSRVNPSHKLQIVRALQQAGLVVAMTGDGINDGPALKAADIGIAMGPGERWPARSRASCCSTTTSRPSCPASSKAGRCTTTSARRSTSSPPPT